MTDRIFLASMQNALLALAKSCNFRLDSNDYNKLEHCQKQLQSLFRHSNVKTQKFTKMMTQIDKPSNMRPGSIFDEINAFYYVLNTFKQKFSTVSFYGDTTLILTFTKCVNSIFNKLFNKKSLDAKLDDLYLWKKETQDKTYFETLSDENEKIANRTDLSKFHGTMLENAQYAIEGEYEDAKRYAEEQAEKAGDVWLDRYGKYITNIKDALYFMEETNSIKQGKEQKEQKRQTSVGLGFSHLTIEEEEEEEEEEKEVEEEEERSIRVVAKISFLQCVQQNLE
jgi:hypothetical protein